jgi:hypothetical protein
MQRMDACGNHYFAGIEARRDTDRRLIEVQDVDIADRNGAA